MSGGAGRARGVTSRHQRAHSAAGQATLLLHAAVRIAGGVPLLVSSDRPKPT